MKITYSTIGSSKAFFACATKIGVAKFNTVAIVLTRIVNYTF